MQFFDTSLVSQIMISGPIKVSWLLIFLNPKCGYLDKTLDPPQPSRRPTTLDARLNF